MSYTKSSPVVWRAHYTSKYFDFDEGGPPSSGSQTIVASSWVGTNTFTGDYNPRWRDQVRNLVNATTICNGEIVSPDPAVFTSTTWNLVQSQYVRPGVPSHIISGQTDGYVNGLSLPDFVVVPLDVRARVRNRAIAKWISACQKIQSTFEAGQDLGEYKETLNGVHRPLNSLKQSILSYFDVLKKARSKYRGPGLRKVLTDTYLEFHFGWQPLAADVADAIADIGRYRFPVYPVNVSAHEDYFGFGGSHTVSGGYEPWTLWAKYRETRRFSVRIKGIVKSGASNGQVSRSQSLQLTPENWLPTAWDLLPYSWMADYFINVGDIIKACCFPYSTVAWGCVTERGHNERSYAPIDFRDPVESPIPGYYYLTKERSCISTSSKTYRTLLNRFPLDSLYLLPTVSFQIPQSKWAYANMAAVMLQRSIGLVPYFM
jgi:hypothetical protein